MLLMTTNLTLNLFSTTFFTAKMFNGCLITRFLSKKMQTAAVNIMVMMLLGLAAAASAERSEATCESLGWDVRMKIVAPFFFPTIPPKKESGPPRS